MRDDRDRLFDIKEEIELIEGDVRLGREIFDEDRHIRDSIVLRLANLGEACRAMTKKFRAQLKSAIEQILKEVH